MKNYYQQLNYIFQNIQFVVGCIGLVSQLLIISVFLRKRLRSHSYGFYSIAMACFNIVICLHTFRHWAAFMFDANIDLVGQFFCAIGEYQPYVSATTSLWLLVLISFDRLMTIAYSNRFLLLKKRWFQALIVAILIAYNLLIHIQLPLNYNLISVNGTDESVCFIPFDVFNIHTWIYLANVHLAIVVINNVLSIKMIYYLIKTRNGLNLNNSNRRSILKDRKFALSAVGLNITTIILKLPLGIALLVSYYLTLSLDEFRALFSICVTLVTSEYPIEFCVYMFVNTVFYEEFLTMVGLKKSKIPHTSQSNFSVTK